MSVQAPKTASLSGFCAYSAPTKGVKLLVEALILIEGNGASRVADCELMRETYGSTGSER